MYILQSHVLLCALLLVMYFYIMYRILWSIHFLFTPPTHPHLFLLYTYKHLKPFVYIFDNFETLNFCFCRNREGTDNNLNYCEQCGDKPHIPDFISKWRYEHQWCYPIPYTHFDWQHKGNDIFILSISLHMILHLFTLSANGILFSIKM